MGANDVLALSANFTQWQSSRMRGLKDVNAFEYYCAENFLKGFGVSDEEILSGLVGGHQNGGIDGMYFFVNRRFVEEETEIDAKTVTKLNLVIIQAKEKDGFSPVAVDKIYFFMDDLLDLAKSKDAYKTEYRERVCDAMSLFKRNYQLVVGESPEFSVEIHYVTKQDVVPNEDCKRSAEKVRAILTKHFSHAHCDFNFVNAPLLWTQVQVRPRKNKALQWAAQPLETPEGFVGLVKLNDYFDFLKHESGELEEKIFESNVRGFWQSTPVNVGIRKTLDRPSQADFWLLNNGITILAGKTSPGGFNKLIIDDPQIVNGLQTSRQIFDYYSGLPAIPKDESRRLLVRVIQTVDKAVRDDVIRATNSQNKMPDEALRATDPIHRQIETLFAQFELYYDRRRGLSKDEGKPIGQIVSVLEVLQAMLAVVLRRPDDARARPRRYMKDDALYTSVFGENVYSLPVYLKSTLLQRRVDDFLGTMRLDHDMPLGYGHRRNLKFYLSMYVASAMYKQVHVSADMLLQLKPEEISIDLILDCYNRVFKHYVDLTHDEYPDSVAKGTKLLKAINTELRRRFSKRKARRDMREYPGS